MGDIHAERRTPGAPDMPLDLDAAAEELLREAGGMSSGRAARTLTPGAHAQLKQTLVALRAGVALSEHETNGPATIQLLRGEATITAGGEPVVRLAGGDWAIIPEERHDLQASQDTVALITVSPVTPATPEG